MRTGQAWTMLARGAMVAVLGIGLVVPMAGGQDATPSADVPGPEDCTVEPVDVSLILANVGSADPNSPLFTTAPVEEADLPAGPAVTDEELDGITGTVRQLVACANAVDPFRILALISEDYIGLLASAALAAQEQPELAEQLLSRFPVPLGAVAADDPLAMIIVRDARLLPDDRVGAILESPVPTTGGEDLTAIFFVSFVESDGTWLVDAVQPVMSEVFGTPAA